jgi:thioredoxin 1
MGAQLLTRENFDDAVARHPVLVVVFVRTGADPVPLDDFAPGEADVCLGRVESDTSPELCAMFGLPPADALVIFRERVVLYCESGWHPRSRVETLLAQVRALDMDAIRAAIEVEKQAAQALHMRRVCPTARRGRPSDE